MRPIIVVAVLETAIVLLTLNALAEFDSRMASSSRPFAETEHVHLVKRASRDTKPALSSWELTQRCYMPQP